MTVQTITPVQDPRVLTAARNMYGLEVGFGRLDMLNWDQDGMDKSQYMAEAVAYVARYDELAAEAGL